MRKGTRKNKVKWEEIEAIIEKYNTDQEFRISTAFPDGGLGLLLPRLGRAAMNQLEDGEATYSRYAIWANTARDTIIEAARRIEKGRSEREIRPLLIEVANSLSAFSDIQALFDTMFHNRSQDGTETV
jgi:hypothetical protein